LNVFQNAKNDPNNTLAFVLYSAHDTTIMPFLNALNSWNRIWPSFAANIIAEYYESVNPSVRLIYNGKPFTIPGCSEFCPFASFEKIINSIIPTANDCKAAMLKQETYADKDISHPIFQ